MSGAERVRRHRARMTPAQREAARERDRERKREARAKAKAARVAAKPSLPAPDLERLQADFRRP